MPEIKWTVAQKLAIEDRGGGLLLSAAAGSGKTAVLVERVVSLISDDTDPINITNLLTVTFSNAAAAEMKQRISKRISELIKNDPYNKHP